MTPFSGKLKPRPRGKADVLYVADAFAVLRKVNELLAADSGASEAPPAGL